jgi:hypothetical protein
MVDFILGVDIMGKQVGRAETTEGTKDFRF